MVESSQGSGSHAAPAEHPAVRAKTLAEQFRCIRFADSVRIAGEALVLTVEIEGASRAADDDGKLKLVKELRPELEAETNRINGLGRGQVGVSYRVDRFDEDRGAATDRAVSLTVTINGLVTKDPHAYRARWGSSSSSSGGELWVTTIDKFVEAVRERITRTLEAMRVCVINSL